MPQRLQLVVSYLASTTRSGTFQDCRFGLHIILLCMAAVIIQYYTWPIGIKSV